jgi:membrane-associated phospholipid phosphatase
MGTDNTDERRSTDIENITSRHHCDGAISSDSDAKRRTNRSSAANIADKGTNIVGAYRHRHWIFADLHDYLLPWVISPHWNHLVVKFQRACGIDEQGNVNNKLLYYLFVAASSLGEDSSYFPILYWYFFDVGISFGTNFVVMLLMEQVVKDLIQLPRPPTHFKMKYSEDGHVRERVITIAKLEHEYGTEYGFPSTHTMSGMLPISVVLAFYRRDYFHSDELWMYLGLAVVIMVCVAFSRLYVGVHSICDLTGGLLLGTFLQVFLHLWGDIFDQYIYQHPFGLMLIICVVIQFIVLYPRSRPWRASFRTAGVIVGLWSGLASSLWYMHIVDPTILATLLQTTATRSTTSFLLVILRLVVALPIMGAQYMGSRFVALRLFITLRRWGLTPTNSLEEVGVDGSIVAEAELYWVQIPTRYTNTLMT